MRPRASAPDDKEAMSMPPMRGRQARRSVDPEACAAPPANRANATGAEKPLADEAVTQLPPAKSGAETW